MQQEREGKTGSAGAASSGGKSNPEVPPEQSGSGSGGGNRGAEGAGSAGSLLPAVSLPTGGGAIRGIGEKFEVNAVTGTASLNVPLPASPGRGGQGPQVGLSYSSGGGNGPFGLGFSLSVPTVTRKTDKGLPRYIDDAGTDTFVLSGAEDLVPILGSDGKPEGTLDGTDMVYVYRPRIEGLFARIERRVAPGGDAQWKVTTPDNVTHIYGSSPASRISDPAAPATGRDARVFTWLLEETRDDKGNITVYEYQGEDGAGVDPTRLSERSRFDTSSGAPVFLAVAQKYLKRVRYANKAPNDDSEFLFEMVFDYGDHSAFPVAASDVPPLSPDQEWGVRVDAFSTYRAGFEERTYRLCRRVLMFHHIDTAEPLLVRSTEFAHDPTEAFTYLTSVEQVGHKLDAAGTTWEHARMPRLELSYQRPEIVDELSTVPTKSLEGLQGGTDGARKQWVDLDGEGIAGVLVDQGGAWFYKENRGLDEVDGALDLKPPRRLHTQPSPGSLSGAQSLEDIDGDGRLELVARQKSLSGYFARTEAGGFEPLRAFESVPNINFQDPNLRVIDLDGDGHGDLLITEDQAFVWYRSRAKKGFEESRRVPVPFDENDGPRVVFNDAEQSIQLADMSGDGLIDIVRIRNGEVSYWPNLGYGKFGSKITLEQSPVFTTPDEFHASRVRFGDLDGSGTSDLIYLSSKGTQLYFNQAGNSLSAPTKINAIPPVDKVTQLNVADLLGTGTSCLVWSSPLGLPTQTLMYVDVMGSKKPHLLTEVNNNLGAITRTIYRSSTQYYLDDKKAGIPWLTRLPFPVQVVDRMEREDAISGGKFVSRYSYRHGFFDGIEREFRGFARVETLDAEDFAEEDTDPLLYQNPVRTISWFHTGAWLEKERLELALQKEYFLEGPPPLLVEDSPAVVELDGAGNEVAIEGIGIQDAREAARALKGSPLRTEVYAVDDSDDADKPYVITETNQQVRRLQPSRSENKYGVFFAYSRESVSVTSERNLSDPRVAHQIALDVDQYGAAIRSVSLVYGRASGDPEQTRAYATLSEADFEHQDDPVADGVFRLGTQIESRSFEVTGLSLNSAGGQLIAVEELRTQLASAGPDIDFDQTPGSGVVRRLLDRQQQTFYTDDLSAETPLGTVGARAIPYKSYQLALTAGNVSLLVSESQALTGAPFDPTLLTGEGQYEDRESNGQYWSVSDRAVFSSTEFYLPIQAIDPFGGSSSVSWDSHLLLPVSATDPVGNVVTSENDYRVLAPQRVTDPNLNRSEVEFDALGMVVATAVMGKDDGSGEGDTLADPTTRLEYDLLAYQNGGAPAVVKTIAREKHGAANPRFQESYAYSDGFGRVIQEKLQAEDGDAPERLGDGSINRDAEGKPILVQTDPRWVGTGRTVFNNKGNPVKQYEPFFSDTFEYEDEDDLVEWGVTPIIRYDSIDRVVRTDFPDGTFTKVEFDSWSQSTFDQNDCVYDPNDTSKNSQWFDERNAPDRDGPEPSNPDERAAWLSAQHAQTPSVTHLDSLGRPYKSITHNVTGTRSGRVEAFYTTRTEIDIEGNTLSITDARGNTSITQVYDVLQRRLLVDSPDAGKRLSVQDVAGKPLRSYNSRGFTSRAEFDAAQRPTHSWVHDGTSETLVSRMSYGESLDASGPSTDPNAPSPAQVLNLRGQVYLAWDSAGQVKTEGVDFKGNVLSASRKLALTYQTTPDWTPLAAITDPAALETAAAGSLEAETFTTVTAYDALNRVEQSSTPTSATLPAVSVQTPEYNEANLLESMVVNVRGQGDTTAVFGLDYNARGQRLAVRHNDDGAGTPSHTINYTYDEKTFRVERIVTTRTDGTKLQDLEYFYDAVGNITEKLDSANWDPDLTTALNGGNAKYQYDALYRLTRATGREHAGQQPDPTTSATGEPPYGSVPHGNDLSGMRDYVEETSYDEVGNITQMRHLTGPSNNQAWTRDYNYFPGGNRLEGTTAPGGLPGNTDAKYEYQNDAGNNGGAHGSMTRMPHLEEMHWDYADRLQHTLKQSGSDQHTYFAYDAGGERVRKVHEVGGTATERIYLGGIEIYRQRAVGTTNAPTPGPTLEREILHVRDDTRRVAMVETKTIDNPVTPIEPNSPLGQPRWRYQLDNHLGSSAMEIDGSAAANVISYEEYHPYGSTAFHLSSALSEVSAKRYRYTGKEKDEETGLYYHGARYYAPWLGRWTAADPAGLVDGLNLYRYSRDNPINFSDPSGTQTEDQEFQDFLAAQRVAQGEDVDRVGGSAEFEGAYGIGAGNGMEFEEEVITAKPKLKPKPKPKPEPVPESASEVEALETESEDATGGSGTAAGGEEGAAGSRDAADASSAAAAFGKGVVEGAVTGAAAGIVLGALGPVGIVIGLGLLGYGLYGLATGGAEDLAASAERIASGEGTEEDFNTAGNLAGGILAGRLRGGKGGKGKNSKKNNSREDGELPEGSFNMANWDGYPSGVAKPSGTLRLLEGAEYDAARKAANAANTALRRADPAKYKGKQIHEIKPVKFGGSPTDPANKVALTPKEHAQYTAFWNRLMRQIQ